MAAFSYTSEIVNLNPEGLNRINILGQQSWVLLGIYPLFSNFTPDSANKALIYLSKPISSEHVDDQTYKVSRVVETLGIGSTIEILIQTATIVTELNLKIGCDGPVDIEFFEGTTFSAAGTSLTAFNTNRTSAKNISSTITHTPTISADGTLLERLFLQPGLTSTENTKISTPWILNSNTDYLVRVVNNDLVTQDTSVELILFEKI